MSELCGSVLCKTLKLNNLTPSNLVGNPIWTLVDISGHFPLIAVVTEELPVPGATLELTYCGCKQTKCSTNRCGCHNIDTALHGCLECSNSNGPTITMIDHDILVLIRL